MLNLHKTMIFITSYSLPRLIGLNIYDKVWMLWKVEILLTRLKLFFVPISNRKYFQLKWIFFEAKLHCGIFSSRSLTEMLSLCATILSCNMRSERKFAWFCMEKIIESSQESGSREHKWEKRRIERISSESSRRLWCAELSNISLNSLFTSLIRIQAIKRGSSVSRYYSLCAVKAFKIESTFLIMLLLQLIEQQFRLLS